MAQDHTTNSGDQSQIIRCLGFAFVNYTILVETNLLPFL